ncbi:MAG: hypothetical protein N2506_00790 [Dehalococcoidales bacterium]|nr:hypothetical protein [Dehalococcoidales bacterium]
MRQFVLTVAAGKRLIARALAASAAVKDTLRKGTLVIVAGTTGSCIAEEILELIGERNNFSRQGFYRGITLPPAYRVNAAGRLAEQAHFPGDVVIRDGTWLRGKTVNDVASELREGDIVIKGANALDLKHRRAAILVGHHEGGTIAAILPAVVGRRVRLIIAVGLEKRIDGDLDALALKVNSPGSQGMRLLPVPGEVFTELEALRLLTGVDAELLAAGGVAGAEGSIRLLISGTEAQEVAAEKLLASLAGEPPFTIP